MTVFVDTSYFIARVSSRDQWHRKALAAVKPGQRFVTASLIVNETISLLQARGHLESALLFLKEMQTGGEIEIVYPDAATQQEAWELFRTLARIGANAVDCVSFAIMQRRSIRKAFTFDAHFRSAGFQTL